MKQKEPVWPYVNLLIGILGLCTQTYLAQSPTYMWVVVHDKQVLGASLWARPLVSSNKPANIVVFQQWEPVDGAFIEEILPVGSSEHFHSHRPLVQRATVDGAVSATPNQLQDAMMVKELFIDFFPLLV